LNKVEDAYVNLMGQDCDDEERTITYDERLQDYQERFIDIPEEVACVFDRADAAVVAVVTAPAPAPLGEAAAGYQSDDEEVDLSMRPKKNLAANCDLGELRVWKSKLGIFFDAQELTKLPIPQQQAYFYMCVSNKLKRLYKTMIPPDTPVIRAEAGIDTCLTFVEADFLQRIPLFDRRSALISMRQKEEESFQWWMVRVQNAGEDADIESMSSEDWRLFILVKSVRDKELKEILRRMYPQDPTLAQVTKTARAFERDKLMFKAVPRPTQPNNGKKSRRSNNKGRY
jgi:hypothetical protein